MQVLLFVYLVALVQAVPLYKRLYQQSSPIVSLIAEGSDENSKLKDELVKFDGELLKVLSDDEAFFGRVKALVGYVLNIPGQGGQAPLLTNVAVKDGQLKAASSANDSAEEFGVEKSKLVFKGSNKFKLCPEGDDEWLEDKWHLFTYLVYTGDAKCPKGDGIAVYLRTQVDATVNYTSDSNVQRFKRWLGL